MFTEIGQRQFLLERDLVMMAGHRLMHRKRWQFPKWALRQL